MKTEQKRLARRRRGLSILEVVVAMAILAVATAGLMAAVAQGSFSRQANRELNLGNEAANRAIEDIRARPVNQALSAYIASSTPFTVADLAQGQGTITFSPATPWPADNAAPYLVEVHVRVTWTGIRGPSHVDQYILLSR